MWYLIFLFCFLIELLFRCCFIVWWFEESTFLSASANISAYHSLCGALVRVFCQPRIIIRMDQGYLEAMRWERLGGLWEDCRMGRMRLCHTPNDIMGVGVGCYWTLSLDLQPSSSVFSVSFHQVIMQLDTQIVLFSSSFSPSVILFCIKLMVRAFVLRKV